MRPSGQPMPRPWRWLRAGVLDEPGVVDSTQLAYAVHLSKQGFTISEIVGRPGATRPSPYRHPPSRLLELLAAGQYGENGGYGGVTARLGFQLWRGLCHSLACSSGILLYMPARGPPRRSGSPDAPDHGAIRRRRGGPAS